MHHVSRATWVIVASAALALGAGAASAQEQPQSAEDAIVLRLGDPGPRLPNSVKRPVVTPDGTALVGRQYDGVPVVVSVESLEVVGEIGDAPESGYHRDTLVAPDGRHVVEIGEDQVAMVVRTSDGTVAARIGNETAKAIDAIFVADGSGVLVSTVITDEEGTFGALLLVDPETGKVNETIEGGEALAHLTTLGVSSDGRRVLLVEDGVPLLLDTRGAETKVTELDVGPDGRLFLSPDGSRVGVADAERGLRLLDGTTLESVAELTDAKGATELVLDAERNRLVVHLANAIVSVELATGREVWRTETAASWIAVATEVHRVICATRIGHLVRLDATNGETVGAPSGHVAHLIAVAHRTDGSYVTLDFDGEWRLWSADGEQIAVHRAPTRFRACALSPDGSTIAAVSDTGRLALVDATTGRNRKRLGRLESGGGAPAELQAAFDRTGRYIAWIDAGPPVQVICAEVATGRETLRRPAGDESLFFVLPSPNGDAVLAAPMATHRVRVTPSEGDESVIATSDGRSLRGVEFSADGSAILTVGSEGGVTTTTLGSSIHADVVRAGDADLLMLSRLPLDPADELVVGASDALVVGALREGLPVFSVTPSGEACWAAFTADAEHMLVGLRNGGALVVDAGPARERLKHLRRIRARLPTEPHTDALGDPMPRGALARLGTTRLRHAGEVVGVAAAPGRIVSLGQDHALRIWDARDGRQVAELEATGATVDLAAAAGTSRVALLSSDSAEIRVVDAADGSVVARPRTQLATGTNVAMSHDGSRTAVVTSAGVVYVFDTATREVRARIDGHLEDDEDFDFDAHRRRTTEVAFVGDDLILLRADGSIDVHDDAAPAGARTLDTIEDGLHVAVVGAANAPVAVIVGVVVPDTIWAHVVDVGTGKRLATLEQPSKQVVTIALSADGSTVAWFDDERRIRRMDVRTGKVSSLAEGVVATPLAMTFTADGARLIHGDKAGRVHVLDAATGDPVLDPAGHDGMVVPAVPAPDGASVATGGMDGHVRIWNVETGAAVRALRAGSGLVADVAWSNDGARIAVITGELGDEAGPLGGVSMVPVLRVLDAKTGEALATTRTDDAHRLAFVPGRNEIVVWGSRRSAPAVFRAADGEPARRLDDIAGCSSLRFTGDDAVALAVLEDEIVDVDVATGTVVARRASPVERPQDLIPLGERGWFVVSRRGMGAFDAALETPTSQWLEGRAQNVSVSPNGRLLAATDPSGSAGIVELATGLALHELGGLHVNVRFLDDDRLLVTRMDGTALIHDVSWMR